MGSCIFSNILLHPRTTITPSLSSEHPVMNMLSSRSLVSETPSFRSLGNLHPGRRATLDQGPWAAFIPDNLLLGPWSSIIQVPGHPVMSSSLSIPSSRSLGILSSRSPGTPSSRSRAKSRNVPWSYQSFIIPRASSSQSLTILHPRSRDWGPFISVTGHRQPCQPSSRFLVSYTPVIGHPPAQSMGIIHPPSST